MEQETPTLSHLRLSLVFCICALFWTALGALLGAIFRHPLAGLIWGGLFGLGYVMLGSWAAEKFPSDILEAKLLENQWAPNLYEMLNELSAKMEMPLPALYSVPVSRPNAFVVAGREGNMAIIVTNGLTRHLDKREVQAVVALMMARLATGVMPSWTIAATLAGLPLHLGLTWRNRRGLEWLGSGVLAAFALPAAGLVRLAWSESVVIAADYHAAHLADSPAALETALSKMEADWAIGAAQPEAGQFAPINPATALLFAVPPLAPAAPGASWWTLLQSVFPSRRPDAAARGRRFLAAPTGVPVEPESS